jgi:predicted esterase
MNLSPFTLRIVFTFTGLFLFSAAYCRSQEDIYFSVPISLRFPDTSGSVRNTDSIYQDRVILKLPANYSKNGKPVRLVYMAHGAGGGVTDSTWFLNRFSLKDSLLAKGYAVFDVNGGPLVENMGGHWSVLSAFKAYEYIREHYTVQDKILVCGFSMGGCSSANFVYRHNNIVIAHGMYSPVLDLYGQAWQNPWMKTTRKAIAITHNFKDPSGNTWEAESVKGWNPLLVSTYDNGDESVKTYPVPVKIWHGSGDRVVRIEATRNFQKYIRNGGGECEVREIDSDDHGLSCGNAGMNRELMMFFKRFEP